MISLHSILKFFFLFIIKFKPVFLFLKIFLLFKNCYRVSSRRFFSIRSTFIKTYVLCSQNTLFTSLVKKQTDVESLLRNSNVFVATLRYVINIYKTSLNSLLLLFVIVIYLRKKLINFVRINLKCIKTLTN